MVKMKAKQYRIICSSCKRIFGSDNLKDYYCEKCRNENDNTPKCSVKGCNEKAIHLVSMADYQSSIHIAYYCNQHYERIMKILPTYSGNNFFDEVV